MASNQLPLPGNESGDDVGHPDRSELQIVLSGVVGRRRVLRAIGPMNEAGVRLLIALVEQSVRNGCTYLRLDLAAVTVVDIAGLRMLRQFQAMMNAIGVTLRFADPHRRTTQRGRLSLPVPSPVALA
jgi:anti-anti-sigma regulatory factor